MSTESNNQEWKRGDIAICIKPQSSPTQPPAILHQEYEVVATRICRGCSKTHLVMLNADGQPMDYKAERFKKKGTPDSAEWIDEQIKELVESDTVEGYTKAAELRNQKQLVVKE